jgi:hypothetical protein
MDFYGADRKLSEMSDRDFTDFLDTDMFNSTVSHQPLNRILTATYFRLYLIGFVSNLTVALD